MPSSLPLLTDAGLVTVSLRADGKLLDNISQVHAITVTKGINRISEACIELLDNDPATGLDCFQPGQLIEVQAGYDGHKHVIFKGIVVGLGFASQDVAGPVLTVLCQDEVVKMSGHGGQLAPVALTTARSTSVALEYGSNVSSFSLRIDVGTQFGAVTAQTQAAGQPQEITAPASSPVQPQPGSNLSSVPLQGTVDLSGTALALPGTMASLTGFATRFNGLAFISGVRHTIAAGTWQTQLNLGTLDSNYLPDEKNSKKGIVTSSRLTLEFDDAKKVITLITPGNNQLIISDEAKGLTLTDQKQNSITLSDQGLALVSKSGLSISAEQDISITSTGGSVNIQAGQQVGLKGLNVSATAAAELMLSGAVSATLKSDMETTIKGAMVMIN